VKKLEKEEIIRGLEEAAEWIVETADHYFDEHHKFMCDAIDAATEIIRKGSYDKV